MIAQKSSIVVRLAWPSLVFGDHRIASVVVVGVVHDFRTVELLTPDIIDTRNTVSTKIEASDNTYCIR
jgi:hypothetical protein